MHKKPVALFFTMNVPENMLKVIEYDRLVHKYKIMFEKHMGPTETLLATDTYQFIDYSKYVSTAFNEAAKAKVRQEEFPKVCQKALGMGISFAGGTPE